jgi:hypothetical protein
LAAIQFPPKFNQQKVLMSEFRFRMPSDWKLSSYHTNSIFIVGLDGMPWPCKVQIETDGEAAADGPVLQVVRNQQESGKLHIVYPYSDRGEMIICTGTLPANQPTYDLVTELARGTLNRLRNQVSIWQEGGLQIAASIHEKVSEAICCLSRAIMSSDKAEQDLIATQSVGLAIEAIFELSQAFGVQISKFRREHGDVVSQFWMANAAGRGEHFLSSAQRREFGLLKIGVEHDGAISDEPGLASLGKPLVLGPWLDASAGGMRQDLIGLSDYHSRRDVLLSDCRQRLENLPGTASLLHLISGLNGIGHRQLSYPQQLQLTIDLLHVVDEALIEIPVMVSFDFPWAERLAGAVGSVHPLQIADSLLRQSSSISFLGLEINLDYWPNGSAIRDPLQWIDLIDIWAQLDLPLVICLRVPSGEDGSDADRPSDRLINQQRSSLTESQRLDFLEIVLPMMIARPTVHGIIWPDWQDGDDPRYPHGGIIDKEGHEKPVGQLLSKLCQVIGYA